MILDSPIISGSLTQQAGQIAEIPRYTAVSSSFLAASASFDARIDSIESTTASLSPRINALESFTASANATYVNASGDSMSGGLTITGSLIVTDRITAQEFHTEYVSSSVVFQSGSTKFGDSGDDIHSFTGSLQIDGNVLASNLNGIFSSSAQITGSLGNYYIVSGTITQTTWDNIENKPAGIVSGSSQVVSLLPTGVVSGSSQITYSSISSIPAGIVSGAMQVTESLDVRYRLVGDDITFAELTFKPTLISGSSQLDGTTIQNLSGSFSGSFSGSYRGDGSGLTGLAAGAKFHTQSTPAATWTFVHNLSTQYPNVTVYGSNNNIILPQSVTATNANTLVLEFGSPVAGYATAGIGGTIEVNGRTIKQYFTSSLSWRFEHNFGDRFASIQTYDSNYEKIIPQTIALTDATSSVITFPEVTEGWAVGTIGGDLPSISSSYAGYTLQVSSTSPYTASWSPIAYVTASNAVNALTASHLNPISQSLIPAVSGTYDLGSVDKPFRHIYVGTGSIYLVDSTGNIVKTLTGDSIVTNDNLSSLNAFTASNFTTNTFTSSASARLNNIETISASNIARLNSIETISASNVARLNSLEIKTGSLATTGSNTFYGQQVFSGSLYVQDNLIVQGSSSLQNITASAVSIGTNIVYLNTDTPAVRFAGLTVQDSGSSAGVTGSMLWDSLCNRWIYSNPSTIGYSGGMLISGPRTQTLGTEPTLTCNYIAKSGGGDHLYDSAMYESGGNVGIGIDNPEALLHLNKSVEGGEGPFIFIDNSAGSTLGNKAGIRFATNAGATFAGYGSFIEAVNTNASNGAESLTFGTWDGGARAERLRIVSNGMTCFSNTICAPSIVSCNGSAFFQRGANGCNGLVISEQGGSITADKASVIRTAGGTSEHLFLTAGINANTSACGYIKLGGDRDACVGINIVPTAALHVNGNIISEGCFFSGAPDNLRIFAGHWATSSGNSNCYLVFQAGGGSSSFGTPTGWGGSASIYTLNQTRLSISCTGVACFSNTVCAASTYLGGCASVGGTAYDFGFEVYSTKQVAITSNNSFAAHLNLIFNRDNTGGTRNCFNILTDQNATYLRTLGSFPLILSTNNSERLTISNTGIASFSCRVGIGFTNPTSFLHVCGNNCGADISCGGGNPDSRGIIHAQLSNVATSRNASVTVETPYGIGQFMEWDTHGMRIGHRVIKGTTCGNVYLTAGQDGVVLTLYCGGEAGFANTVCFSGHVIPTSNNSYCLGNSTYAWAHIYTNDLHLSNEGKCGGNDVDGTNGNWTIQEGAENLYIINNKNSKKFKIQLQEII